MKRSLIALSLALCAALCGCSGGEAPETPDPVSVWYVEDQTVTQPLNVLIDKYNLALPAGEAEVKVRAFANEETLAEALEVTRPDMMLCYHSKAVDLHDRELLSDVSAYTADCAPDYVQSLDDSSGCVGTSFFPLGCIVGALVYNEKLCGDCGGSSLEELCISSAKYYEATGLPFFGVESYSELFFSCMDGLGQSFRADGRVDARNENYKYIYNLLSDAAYNRGMDAASRDVGVLLADGRLPCAVLSSISVRLLPEGLSLAPSPQVSGGGRVCAARVLGLAVTAETKGRVEASQRFLRWMLQPQQLSSMCDSAGLMSAVEGGGSGGLGAELAKVYDDYTLYMISEDSEYFKNRETFDSGFRAAMEYVA